MIVMFYYLFLRMGKTSVCLEAVRVERTPLERERLKMVGGFFCWSRA